ncbi:MAG: acyl carrier protein [Anaerolineae bacterium]|nr:acyl carrier protein [Anaerolineae bacterium]MCO5188459.1 acyl carrier protein [Anaerolineae bacterium]MCO5192185.1 acyl carrier protein [Anaerolineae bacterium]MCO5198381.1 acyl carrier protein [Anaerolineae bacterium]MCO5205788.1 acyl carrier protein [Anaerolineae bacterium]
MNTEQILERFIVDELLLGAGAEQIGVDDPLVSSRVLDSLGLLRMVTFIEERFGVTIEDGELIPDNFETIRQITEMIASKQPTSAD